MVRTVYILCLAGDKSNSKLYRVVPTYPFMPSEKTTPIIVQ